LDLSKWFPFLIGRIRTSDIISALENALSFPFLIGRIRTLLF